MSNRHVAIDGPSASGKTVVSRALAARLGTLYLDTGAMYRAVAYLALHHAIDLDNEHALVEQIAHFPIRIAADTAAPAGYRVYAAELDITAALTQPEVTAAVSTVAAAPAVRAALVERQRAIAAVEPVVMAGRDIGTVVLPDARYKFFLTASLDERAKRRAAELAAGGFSVDAAEVAAQLAERDRLDSVRATAPLKPAADAVHVDSTALDIEEVLAAMLARIEAA
jgi:cytidylate kinase